MNVQTYTSENAANNGRSGPRISNIADGSSYRFYFLFTAWKIRQEKHSLCKPLPTITNGEYRHEDPNDI